MSTLSTGTCQPQDVCRLFSYLPRIHAVTAPTTPRVFLALSPSTQLSPVCRSGSLCVCLSPTLSSRSLCRCLYSRLSFPMALRELLWPSFRGSSSDRLRRLSRTSWDVFIRGWTGGCRLLLLFFSLSVSLSFSLQDDLALRLIHEHLVTAVSPVSIPPYISEKRSFLPQEDKTFLADRREHLAKTTSVLHHHHHHAPASSSSASLLHVAFSSTEHSRDREAEIERPDESEGEGKKPRDGRDESSEEDERAQRDRSSQEDLKEGAPGGAAMRKEEEEKEEGKKKKKNRKDGRLPLHLRKARERYESATYLVRSVSHSPLTRFNRLLLAEAIDRWWKAWQLRRFAGLLKKKFKTLKHLGRQMQVNKPLVIASCLHLPRHACLSLTSGYPSVSLSVSLPLSLYLSISLYLFFYQNQSRSIHLSVRLVVCMCS